MTHEFSKLYKRQHPVRIESYLLYVDHNIAIHFWILLGVVARVCERHGFRVRKADMRMFFGFWFLVFEE